MNNIKKSLQKTILILIACIFIFSHTTNSYAGLGNYTENSTNLSASMQNSSSRIPNPIGVGLIIAGVYGAGYALGTIAHHVYNSFLFLPTNNENLASTQYDKNDFSKFDNL